MLCYAVVRKRTSRQICVWRWGSRLLRKIALTSTGRNVSTQRTLREEISAIFHPPGIADGTTTTLDVVERPSAWLEWLERAYFDSFYSAVHVTEVGKRRYADHINLKQLRRTRVVAARR